MGNITSYLKWRGDLTFQEHPFGHVDNLVLSVLSYFHFDGIVPAVGERKAIALHDAVEQFLQTEEKVSELTEENRQFIKALVQSRRYGSLRLRNYIDLYNLEGTNTDFSAMEICLPNNCVYTAFRGTGGALLGWREDFSMCYQVMPAQRFALEYLQDTYDPRVKNYIFGGHSKGGNIALYAAVNCEEKQREKLQVIYSNDGPGLCGDIVDPEKVDLVRDRLIRIVPEFSIIGALFRPEAETIIVKSSAEGLLQHSALTWEVEGDEFVTCEKHSSKCQFYNDVLRTWIEDADMEQREGFTNQLFDALEANGTRKLGELSENGADDFLVILISLTQADQKTRNVMLNFGRIFLSSVQDIQFSVFIRQKKTIQAFIIILAGMCAALLTDYAAAFAGIIGGAAAAVYIGKRLLDTAFAQEGTIASRKIKVVIQMTAMCLLMILIANRDVLVRITHLLIGIGFLIYSYRWLKRAFTLRPVFPKRVLGLLLSLMFFIVGVLPLIPGYVTLNVYMQAAGGILWFYGIGLLVYQAYENGKENRKLY